EEEHNEHVLAVDHELSYPKDLEIGGKRASAPRNRDRHRLVSLDVFRGLTVAVRPFRIACFRRRHFTFPFRFYALIIISSVRIYVSPSVHATDCSDCILSFSMLLKPSMASISILPCKIPVRSLRCVLLLPLACASVLLVGAESGANTPNSDCINSFSILLKPSMASISHLGIEDTRSIP
ncbi:hypothetical protein BHE74_00059661, partial [Ensete ventricosum]